MVLANLRWLGLSALVVAFDQWSKWAIVRGLQWHESVFLLPGLDFRLVRNFGAAFSFWNDGQVWQRWFFITLAVVIGLVLLRWLLTLPARNRWSAASIALVLGGAVGNLIDRVRLGYVVDFIDVHVETWHWPTFNLADSAITVGVCCLIVLSFFEGATQKQASRQSGEDHLQV